MDRGVGIYGRQSREQAAQQINDRVLPVLRWDKPGYRPDTDRSPTGRRDLVGGGGIEPPDLLRVMEALYR